MNHTGAGNVKDGYWPEGSPTYKLIVWSFMILSMLTEDRENPGSETKDSGSHSTSTNLLPTCFSRPQPQETVPWYTQINTVYTAPFCHRGNYTLKIGQEQCC